MNTPDEKKATETHWAPIFKDMGILMCVMGLIALICKLIMMPFEITTPTDTLVSLIRKGGVTAIVKEGKAPVIDDEPFMKELRLVTGQADPEAKQEESAIDKMLSYIGLGSDSNEQKENNINTVDNTGRTALMWAVYSNYNTPPTANAIEEIYGQVADELAAYKDAALEEVPEGDPAKLTEKMDKVKESSEKLWSSLNELKENVERGTTVTWNKKDVQRLYYLRALLAAPGINICAADKDGFTALHWAAWSGMPFCTFTLAQAGLDINAQENNGYTPLMLAAMRGNDDTVAMLMHLGANKEMTNAKGDTAATLAQAAATAYHKSDTVVYKLIYSKQRNAAYARTVKILTGGVDAMSAEDIEKQMNSAWARYERQLMDKAKAKTEQEAKEIKAEEKNVQDAAGEPAYSDNPDQENP